MIPSAMSTDSLTPVASPPLFSVRRLVILGICLAAWFGLCEVATWGWYYWRESQVPVTSAWNVAWPTPADAEGRGFVGFSEREMSDTEKELLRFERGNAASWRTNAEAWSGFFIQWPSDPRLNQTDLSHNPTVCLTGAGLKLESALPDVNVQVPGENILFRAWKFGLNGRPVFVYVATRWDREFARVEYRQGEIGRRFANFERALAGNRGNPRETLELVALGPSTAEQAEAGLRREVARIFSTSSQSL